MDEQNGSMPYHESIIPAFEDATNAPKVGTLLRLAATTKTPENHDTIMRAAKDAAKRTGLNDPTILGRLFAHLKNEKRVAEKKAWEKSKPVETADAGNSS